MHMPDTTDGKKWHPAPNNGHVSACTGGIFGVYLAPGEKVIWSKTYLQNGDWYVSGYTIIPRKEDWEVFAENIGEDVFRKLDESGKNFHDDE